MLISSIKLPRKPRYWNVGKIGPNDEDPPNFDNFRPFGPWKTPAAKQFGQVERVCGHIVNRNIYKPSKILLNSGIGRNKAADIGGIGLE
ncbi:unnamed protein product [Strongylus vulgaris]|uniref:Uncharacterized protein n=1 Tax=Strongylus vulgaris TaxID=40348 RepID=A0A3P7JGY2_STRVU|nr:unnamed protein product [Strongylus vulgaris]